mgnify:FL=1
MVPPYYIEDYRISKGEYETPLRLSVQIWVEVTLTAINTLLERRVPYNLIIGLPFNLIQKLIIFVFVVN